VSTLEKREMPKKRGGRGIGEMTDERESEMVHDLGRREK
jgi:hypothetical protein